MIRTDLFPALLCFPFASVSQKQRAMKSASIHSVLIDWAMERGNWLGGENEYIHVKEDPREDQGFLPEMCPCRSGKFPVIQFASTG